MQKKCNGTVAKITSNNPQNTKQIISSKKKQKTNPLWGCLIWDFEPQISVFKQHSLYIFSHTFLLTHFFILFYHIRKNLHDRILNEKSKEQQAGV